MSEIYKEPTTEKFYKKFPIISKEVFRCVSSYHDRITQIVYIVKSVRMLLVKIFDCEIRFFEWMPVKDLDRIQVLRHDT